MQTLRQNIVAKTEAERFILKIDSMWFLESDKSKIYAVGQEDVEIQEKFDIIIPSTNSTEQQVGKLGEVSVLQSWGRISSLGKFSLLL